MNPTKLLTSFLDQRDLKVNEPDFSYGDVLTPSIPNRGYSDPTFRRKLRRYEKSLAEHASLYNQGP